MIRKCYAKINLSLDILAKRPDGYHDIDTIMARIDLYDKLKIEKTQDNKFHYESNYDLGELEDNLVYKAYKILSKSRTDRGIRVKLYKNIPVAAGLAGGSSDCAEMIMGLNEIWDLKLSKEKMMEIGASLGADVPYFFLKKSARARGIGEKLESFQNKLKAYILLINDGTEISSAYVYKRSRPYGKVAIKNIVDGLRQNDRSVVELFSNTMEEVVLRDFPQLNSIKDRLKSLGASKSLVSGSGASIFAIFFNKDKFDKAYQELKDSYYLVRKVELIDD